ncbi:hypothetical protein P175DRAFT_0531814 [Aspergillus ochraceoroseus IBT 24754]|uniref:Thioester reductase (TE) domain-containing protein n=1 Tax=Aspergillus ochraceoroseus IBT 24754 TaxID=1392256 RepID=A0A2T5LW15_9EURO|nr:uncharacterized protein P175DRAFT_0531814 [Aspergillus ochraceoroseus IBT 24754]PTU20477.1 hypothetical protein P175DRAFT_0531814 [Aspergillus ochraceoroseus IBT 24754]
MPFVLSVEPLIVDPNWLQGKQIPLPAISGSTGIPNPRTYTHEFPWRISKANILPPPEGKTLRALDGVWFFPCWRIVSQCFHSRISKAKALILDPEKPMLRAGKGTVQREGTIRLYSDEIDALYRDADIAAIPERQINHSLLSLEDLGLRLSTPIRSTFTIASISPALIYKNPSVDLLARWAKSEILVPVGDNYNRLALIRHTLEGHQRQVDSFPSFRSIYDLEERKPTSQVMLLTGSTGAIGSFILDRLLVDMDIAYIYCLNRAADSRRFKRLEIAKGVFHAVSAPIELKMNSIRSNWRSGRKRWLFA